LKIPTLGEFRGKIERSSTSNLLCLNFQLSVGKMQLPAPYFFNARCRWWLLRQLGVPACHLRCSLLGLTVVLLPLPKDVSCVNRQHYNVVNFVDSIRPIQQMWTTHRMDR